MSVLIATPTFEGMEYCFLDFIEHLKNINYPNFDILIVDNSRSKRFLRKIKKIPGIKVIYDETKEDKNIDRLISSRNKILDYVSRKNYEYLLMMDSDVMVPKNILLDLIRSNKEVVSGLYFNQFKVDGKIKILPVAYKEAPDNVYEEYKRKYPKIVKTKEDVKVHLTELDVEKGKIIESIIPSCGCLLLSRKSFTSGARYGLLEVPKGVHTTEDIYFCKELRKRGFKLYCDTSLVCKHFVNGKRNKEGVHPIGE